MATPLYALIALYLTKHWDIFTFNGVLSEKCEGQKVYFNFLWTLCECFTNHHTQVEWLAFEIFQTNFWVTQRTKCFGYSVKSNAILIIDFTHLWHQLKISVKLVNGFWNCLLYERSIWRRKLFFKWQVFGWWLVRILAGTHSFTWISTVRFLSRHLQFVIVWVQSFDVRWSECWWQWDALALASRWGIGV